MNAIKVYSSVMNREEKPSKCVLRDNGCEVVSNDGQMKILLTRHREFSERVEQGYYVTCYYIYEDDGWVVTSTKNTYKHVGEFIDALRQTEEFSQAVDDYDSLTIKTTNNNEQKRQRSVPENVR